jgi:hypothetical protein
MKYLFSILFLISSYASFSQRTQVRGVIFDSTLNKYISDASVVLLNKDSIILADVRSSQTGSFVFSELKNDQPYILVISYPEYVSLSRQVPVPAPGSELVDLGKIQLFSKAVLLKEVVVTSKLRDIQLRGDTIQYSTAAIQLLPNSTVEDLLKILPGLQVDQHGRITAQGRKIKKVLVDGEEFFSDDPAFVTRNLRAEMIGKVQIYDKKTDAAVFTGIDDGIKDKVINLQIKQDKSTGVFGKLEGGIGTGNQYTQNSVQAMLNVFKGKKKMSAYFSSNNIGQFGLGSSERKSLGVGNEAERYDGKGLPEFSSAGIHFDNKWNKDRSSINSDYYYFISNISGYDSSFSRVFLPVGLITKTANTDFSRERIGHKANLSFIQKVGANATLSVSALGYYGKGAASHSLKASDVDSTGNFLNKNANQANSKDDNSIFNVSLLFQRKFKKPGRTISFSIDNKLNTLNEQQANFTNTIFFNGKPSIDSVVDLDLLKNNKYRSQSTLFGINLSESLSKSFSVLFSATSLLDYIKDDGLSSRVSSAPGSFDQRFSTIRDDSRETHTANVSFDYAKNKFRVSFGGAAGVNQAHLEDRIKITDTKKNFSVWKPFGRVQYVAGSNTNLAFSYRGNTINPNLQELSPYSFDNTQLLTYLDNYALANAWSNNFSLTYDSFKNLTKTFTALVAKYGRIDRPIKRQFNIDAGGAYFVQYINMTGLSDDEFEVTGFYSRPLKKLQSQLTVDVSGKAGTSFSYINGSLNKLNYNTASVGLLLYKNRADKYEADAGATVTYNANTLRENNQDTRNNFFSLNLRSSIDYFIKKVIQLHSDAEFTRQGKNQIFPSNFDRFLWNVWISKKLLKSNQLTIKIAVNDLLNSNSGFSRSASFSTFSENRYLTLRRYVMLSASWNFTKYKQLTK